MLYIIEKPSEISGFLSPFMAIFLRLKTLIVSGKVKAILAPIAKSYVSLNKIIWLKYMSENPLTAQLQAVTDVASRIIERFNITG